MLNRMYHSRHFSTFFLSFYTQQNLIIGEKMFVGHKTSSERKNEWNWNPLIWLFSLSCNRVVGSRVPTAQLIVFKRYKKCLVLGFKKFHPWNFVCQQVSFLTSPGVIVFASLQSILSNSIGARVSFSQKFCI